MEKKILFLRADHDTTVSHFSRKHRADNSLLSPLKLKFDSFEFGLLWETRIGFCPSVVLTGAECDCDSDLGGLTGSRS